MASIGAATSEKIFQLKQFYGLNENPDGDTKLKLGEAAAMKNWRVTRDGNLQRRPGTLTIKGLAKEYSLDVSTAAETVFDAASEHMKLKMYPEAGVVDGLVSLSGESVNVDCTNAAASAGLYWRRDASHVWKLADCTKGEDGYIWRFYRVKAKAAGNALRVAGLWTGFVAGREELLAACDGKLWRLWDAENGAFIREALGDIDTSKNVHMFGFSNIVYMLNGSQYKQWDGTTLQDVHGYRPLVRVSVPPAGGGETKEEVNRLCGERRLWISPDGETATFALPEKGLVSVDYVFQSTRPVWGATAKLHNFPVQFCARVTVNTMPQTILRQNMPAASFKLQERTQISGAKPPEKVCQLALHIQTISTPSGS